MVIEAPARPVEPVERMDPPVYFAGPIDYVEHRSPGDHLRDNWRHRFFGDLQIDLLCPTCINAPPAPDGTDDIMSRNREALRRAEALVAYFPGDVATFGTPLEVETYLQWAVLVDRPGTAILVHPARPGVFVKWFEAQYGLVVVKTFEEARSALQHRLWRK